MRNQWWTIRFDNGWFNPDLSYTRKDAIAKYLALFENGRKRDWAWRRHKRVDGLSVVRVQIVEV